jgi:hypothetical protein
MTAIVNPYFHANKGSEQTLLNSLVRESIQVHGRQYYYLPRDAQVKDVILGEDVVSAFTLAIPLEMYMVDAQGFSGQKEMFSKFGLQIQNSYKLVVAVDRWEKEVKSQFDTQGFNGEAGFTIPNYLRPHEGDLIYDSLTNFLMVIKFVDHDMEFYSLGKNYVYYLSCESFLYQNEAIATAVPEIDTFASLSMDDLNFQLMTETGVALRQEDGNFILQEESPTPQEPTRSVNMDYTIPAQSINTTVASNPFNM